MCMKTKILCVDTTSDFCSVSLFLNERLVETNSSIVEKSHSELLLSLIGDTIENKSINIKEIDAFSISRGPGSYTGLRIGLSTLKGLCFALDKPLISVNTLKILAFQALRKIKNTKALLCPMIDARRMEVYTKLFDYDLNEIQKDKSLILDNDSFSEFDQEIYFFGNGANKFQTIATKNNFKFINDIYSNSKFMGDISYRKFILNKFEDLSSFEPNYIKDFYLRNNG